jgi:phage terminase large subunit-like protein
VKKPWKRGKGMNGAHPVLIILDEIHEYGSLDRMDGLKESMERHPSNKVNWGDRPVYLTDDEAS